MTADLLCARISHGEKARGLFFFFFAIWEYYGTKLFPRMPSSGDIDGGFPGRTVVGRVFQPPAGVICKKANLTRGSGHRCLYRMDDPIDPFGRYPREDLGALFQYRSDSSAHTRRVESSRRCCCCCCCWESDEMQGPKPKPKPGPAWSFPGRSLCRVGPDGEPATLSIGPDTQGICPVLALQSSFHLANSTCTLQ